MKTLVNKEFDEIVQDLEGKIFRNPLKVIEDNRNSGWETADEYLSGDVKEKLKIAEEYAKNDESYSINVKSLTEVQPIPLSAEDIELKLGATWIPAEFVKDFMKEKFKYLKEKIWITIELTLPRISISATTFGWDIGF